MSHDPSEPTNWRDFGHTVSVLLAAALAEYEAAQDERLAPRFQITLLAAAMGDELALPMSEIVAPGGGLGISLEVKDNEVIVTLQLKGFDALSKLANRDARLKSANGAIDYEFRFSEQGRAVCVLADTPEVRRGLGQLHISEIVS